MEDEAVIVGALFFLAGHGILKFLGAFGEADEVLDSFGSFLFE
jgi:hypothetical protein